MKTIFIELYQYILYRENIKGVNVNKYARLTIYTFHLCINDEITRKIEGFIFDVFQNVINIHASGRPGCSQIKYLVN